MKRLLLILGSACLMAVPAGAAQSGQVAPTWNKDVAPIVYANCITCHRPGEVAPMSLMSYADARPWARAIREAVLLKTMPPWKPVNSHGVFEGERTLTDEEIQTISQWVDDGSPQGAASDQPEPISFSQTWSAGTPDLVVQPPSAYAVKIGRRGLGVSP